MSWSTSWSLPMALVALVLHVPVAWLLRRLYHQTPFREALGHYEKQIQCTPYSGPDADHPYNHGLQAVTLRGFWQHFEGFILEYNMHFVVSNLVRPLTKSKQIAFVDLWGGRRVDYFVSHSWITGFRHFVRSIHCHALSNDGPAWTDAAYWICSFANNQWNIAAELGTDPMSSAFARVLTNGPKEVAMVLDKEVQPLTRVWCLFEFLLASRHQVHLVFVTDDGVVGTMAAHPLTLHWRWARRSNHCKLPRATPLLKKTRKTFSTTLSANWGASNAWMNRSAR
eukprot:Skav202499  [mRNA]  locus=scaffold32:146273:151503:- [translate_table: standard]